MRSPSSSRARAAQTSPLEVARRFLDDGQPIKAIAPAMHALWDAERSGAQDKECHARALFARALGHSGDHLSAMVQFQRAFVLSKALSDLPAQRYILDGLGNTYLALGGYAEAQRAHRGAIAVADRISDRRGKAIACAELIRTLCRNGEDLLAEGKRAAATRFFRRALTLADHYLPEVDCAGTPAAVRVFYRVNRAYALTVNRRYEESDKLLIAAARSATFREHGRYWAVTTSIRAHLTLERGEFESATQQLIALTPELIRMGHNDVLLKARSMLVAALEGQQRLPEALAVQRLLLTQLRALGRDVLLNRSRIEQLHAEIEQQRARAQQMTQAANQWEQKAHIDALTGLHSRRKLEDELITARAKRNTKRIVLMIDLDYFKAINDRHGHQAGDKVLIATARVLEQCLKSLGFTDKLALYRYGGEEFAAIGEQLSGQQGLAVAEKLRANLKRYPWRGIAKGLTVTASVGIYQGSNPLAHALLVADAALYRAKQSGRDRATLA
jgi:diguanylate cyclase (GGDEF)-like protein